MPGTRLPQDTIGQILDGRYKLVEELAAGGFAQIYLAEDLRRPGNPKCVVKHLNPSISSPDFIAKARELFKTEAQTLERLGHHDRIPRLFAYIEHKEQDEYYLVQEYVEGHPLTSELLPGGQLPEARVVKLLHDVLEILAYVHGQGVIHRDIKPSNLIRRHADGKVVLIDFGTVKQVEAAAVSPKFKFTLPIGTPGYMSGEQERGKACPGSDLYALGMVAIQALSGIHPHELPRNEAGKVLWKKSMPKIAKELTAILEKMVGQTPEKRYQSAAEVLQALATIPDPFAKKKESPARQASSFYRSPLLQLAFGTALAITVMFLIFQGQQTPRDRTVPDDKLADKLADERAIIAPQPATARVNYSQLREYLGRRDWRSADAATYAILLQLSGKNSYAKGTIFADEARNLSCADLILIDMLWREASDDRLGFSPQQKVWRSLGNNWSKMYEKVGWRSLDGTRRIETHYDEALKRWLYADAHLPQFADPSYGHLPLGVRNLDAQGDAIRGTILDRCNWSDRN